MNPAMLCYVAGPYRAKTGWEIDQNIQRARALGAEVAKLGIFPVVPHANTAHYDGIQTDEFWLKGTLALLQRCDIMILTEDWLRSSGARAEHNEAQAIGMPVFFTLEGLEEWLALRVELGENRDYIR